MTELDGDVPLETLAAGELAEVSGGATSSRDLWTVSALAVGSFASMFGAKQWCHQQNRSGTLMGDAVCAGIYERQGKQGQHR